MAEADALEMTTRTPHLAGEDKLTPYNGRYVDIASLPWVPTAQKGIKMKILLEDRKRGLMTALIRWEPGARLPMHVHGDIEQIYLIEGSLADDEGEVTAGNFCWRPKNSRHSAYSPNGALVFAVFLQPAVSAETGAILK